MSVGGMAELYLASTPGPGGFQKAVALKQVLPEFRDDPQFVQRFLDEARITATLTHPHIGQVFDLGEADGELYLAMEFIAGVDLARVAFANDKDTQLPPGFVARIGRDVALALASAHGLSDATTGESTALIHRDINPKNVMVTFDGVVKVVDFGLAKFRGRRAKTAVGQVRGTPQYMAPEQLRDEPLDGRTDLYGLGVVLWELLAGRFLAEGGVDEVIARLQRGERAPDVRTVAPDVPEALAEVITTCLQNEKSKRFGSARELARALERCGVELFDEGQVAELLRERLPETKRSLTRLVALAQQANADADAIKAELRTLRKADQAKSAVTLDELKTPVEAQAALPSAREEEPTRSGGAVVAMLVGAAALLALISGAGWYFTREPAAVVEALDETAADAQWRGRQALNEGDPLRALEIVRTCVGARGPCKGLESVKALAQESLAKSACGSDAQARAVVSEAGKLPAVEAGVKLRSCVAGKVLHPLAAQAIQQLELVK